MAVQYNMKTSKFYLKESTFINIASYLGTVFILFFLMYVL